MSQIKSVGIIGAGWLGKDLAIYLKELGYDVIGSRTNYEGVVELEKLGVKGTVFDVQKTEILPDDLKKEIIIITLPPSSAKDGNYGRIIKRILDKLDLRTKKVIFTSSTGVYFQESGIYDENSPTADSLRAKTILEAEDAIREYSPSFCVLRLGGLTGIDRHPGNRNSLFDLVSNEPINLVFKGDILRAFAFIIKKNLSGIFNLVAPIHPNRGEYYNLIFKKLGSNQVLSKTANKPLNRTISSEKIQTEGFKFEFENPLEFPIK